jgi:4,5-dihydroxyphthalate decarboxylase
VSWGWGPPGGRPLPERANVAHARLFEAFTEAKAVFLKQLGSGGELSADAQMLAQRRSVVGDNPLPYGLAPNRKAMEAVIRFAHEQKILPRRGSPEEMVASGTLDLD